MFRKKLFINKKVLIILIGILLVALFLRVYKIYTLPLGLNIDEVSQGYNAYSLLLTGRDRYGKLFPILFKSYQSFQPPLYTYLTVIPTFLFGKSNLSIRFISIISHLVVIYLTFLIVRRLFPKNVRLALVSSFIIAICPWSIFFARYATEASLGLVLILSSLYFFIAVESKKVNVIVALLFLGLSTHAYYTERVVAPFLLLAFIVVYRKFISKNKKVFWVGMLFFSLMIVPHFYMVKEGSFFRRFDQVTYLDYASYERFGGRYQGNFSGRFIYVANEFLSQYLAYYSPKNLFFFADAQEGRSIPDLSVFYSWMVIPFLLGIIFLTHERFSKKEKLLTFTMLVSVIPAAMSNDPFYTLRVLLFLWFISIIISFGLDYFYNSIRESPPIRGDELNAVVSSSFRGNPALSVRGGCHIKTNNKKIALLLILTIITFSLFDFYRKYFVLFKHERASNFGYFDKVIADYFKDYHEEVLIDLSERDLSTGLRMAYYLNIPPQRFQEEIGSAYLDNYYNGYEVEKQYYFDNIQVRPIVWEEDAYKKQLIVGDNISISDDQVQEHELTLLYQLDYFDGRKSIRIFSTNPKKKCDKSLNGINSEKCLNYLK